MKFNPWPKNIFLKTLAVLWSLPTALIGFITFLILLCSGQVKSLGWKDGALDIVALKDSWFQIRFEKKWAGFSLGWCVFYFNDYEYNNITTRMHERVHTHQQLVLGIFQWIFYALFYIVILAGTKLSGYAANPFEIDAKMRSGQIIDIERLSKL